MEISIKPDTISANKLESHKASADVEALFISQMLTHARIGAPDSSFSGGIGEAQFTSFLIDEYAKILAPTLDLGIIEGLK